MPRTKTQYYVAFVTNGKITYEIDPFDSLTAVSTFLTENKMTLNDVIVFTSEPLNLTFTLATVDNETGTTPAKRKYTRKAKTETTTSTTAPTTTKANGHAKEATA